VATRFVAVPAAAIRNRLAAAGFHLTTASRGSEEVYDRQHERDDRYVVRVYSSLTHGADDVRECGEDAIRVVALYTDSKFHYPPKVIPIFSASRVYRTGTVEGVLDRMIERAREAYTAINAHRKGPLRCSRT
jgi:hypothetical protein